MRNTSMLISSDGEQRSMLSVTRVLLSFRLNTQNKSNKTKYVSRHCMQCTEPLNDVDEKQDCALMRWRVREGLEHRDVARMELQSKMDLNINDLFQVGLFRAIFGLQHVVREFYEIPLPNTGLPCSYHCFQISKLCRDDQLNQGGIQ